MIGTHPTSAHSAKPPYGLRVGIDLVQISRISDSIDQFGNRFIDRLFTDDEIEYANRGSGLQSERLAARFAAKEAAIKALQLSDAGVGWRDIEVRKLISGECALALHGRVAELAKIMEIEQIALSLSHDGDYAGAVVTVLHRASQTAS